MAPNYDSLLVRARKFWRAASMVTPDQEAVDPERGKALEFDKHRGKRVLDYGCGGGSDVLSYLRRKCYVTAMDIVPANVATTEMRVREDDRSLEFTERIFGVVLEVPNRIPIGLSPDNGWSAREKALSPAPPHDFAGAFDVANVYGVVHCVPDEIGASILREVARVLVPMGILYITLPTRRVETEQAYFIERHMKRHRLEYNEALGWLVEGEGCPFVATYGEREGSELIQRAGLRVTTIYEHKNGYARTFQAVRSGS